MTAPVECSSTRRVTRRKIKQEIFLILAEKNRAAIEEALSAYEPADLINPLFTALCSTSDKVRFNAVRAFGWAVPAIADRDLESARIIMRRFLWSLNDESGGIGWGAPEAMAEIMLRDERLAREYLHMLVSYMREDGPEPHQDGNFIELPMLQRGVLWGIGRLCAGRGQRMREFRIEKELQSYLRAEDPVVRGLAVWCLTILADDTAEEPVLALRGDNSEVPVCLDDQIRIFTVDELVERYLLRIAAGPGTSGCFPQDA